MLPRFRIALLFAAALLLGLAPSRALNPAPFLEEHCFDCHDEQEQKGGLRLDNLPADFAKPESARVWIDVLDRMEAGEMPPKKKAQPPAPAKHAFLTSLKQELLTAENARQRAEGRVVLRRLNRTEYENTVRDLLGIEAELQSLLPEDASAEGFDNIGAALNISSVLMERYLEVADLALDRLLVRGPGPVSTRFRMSLMPQRIRTDLPPGKKDYRLAAVRVMGEPSAETIVFFNSGTYQPVTLESFRAPVEGRYRFRARAYAYQSQGRTLTLGWYGGQVNGNSPITHLIGHFDVAPEPSVMEFEDYLPARGSLKPLPLHLGQRQIDDSEKYAGQGIAVEWVEVEGPLVETWPPRAAQQMLGGIALAEGTLADAEKAIRWLAPRAFRRPITEEDVQPYVGLVQAQLAAQKPFAEALRAGLKAILCSPDFLFLRETPGPLDDHALATRLSYFLWSSLPDEALRKLADARQLHRPAVLRQQVERMLADPKAQRFTENFTGQWLGLRNIDFTTPDKKLYPEHDDALQEAMVKETRLFFEELLRKDLSVTNIVHSDFAMLNERLAEHYGIEGVKGQELRRVPVPPASHRGGVLTQAAVLKVSANGTNTSPVIRGNWVLRNILGTPAKPPPAGTPAIEPDIRGAQSIREQISKHRELGACASCHDHMDPPGLALENFDVIGGWRENYRSIGVGDWIKAEVDGRRVQYKRGPVVDASGVLPDGSTFTNIDDFKKLLLAKPEQIAKCVTEKLVTYATGSGIHFGDRAAIKTILQQSAAKQYGLRTILHEVVQSDAFVQK